MSEQACWQNAIVDAHGELVTDASVEVRLEAGGGLATLYSDRDGSNGTANPILPGSDGYPASGFVRFFTAPGVYKITVTSATAGTRDYRYVVLLVNEGAGEQSETVSVNIASGNVDDFEPAGLSNTTAVLWLNPSSGDSALRSLVWDALPDGAELVIGNAHASNVLTIKANDTNSDDGAPFVGAYDATLNQYMALKVKKSTLLGSWIMLP